MFCDRKYFCRQLEDLKMKSFIVLLIFLPSILCASGKPKPCCVGNQFSAYLSEMGGQVDPKTGNRTFIDFTSELHYDYDNKMMFIRRSAQGADDMDIIIDYNTHLMYIQGKDYCVYQNSTDPMRQPCVPDNSTYLGRSLFGSQGHHIEVDSWRIDFPTSSTKISVTTDGNCIPVFESELSATQQLTLFVSNVTKTINTSLFAIPKTCIPIPS